MTLRKMAVSNLPFPLSSEECTEQLQSLPWKMNGTKQYTLGVYLDNEKNQPSKTIFTFGKLSTRHLCLAHSLGRVIAHQVDGLGPYLSPDVHVVAQIDGAAYPAARRPHHL